MIWFRLQLGTAGRQIDMNRNFLVLDPELDMPALKGLASPIRVQILKLLHNKGPMNVNDIVAELSLPQSTVSTNVKVLEEGGLIRTENQKARKGSQKVCYPMAEEVLVVFKNEYRSLEADAIEVSMPIGLYTSFAVTAPCGLCSPEGIIGGHHRSSRCPRFVPRSRPHEGGLNLVHKRTCRVPIPQ